jgi:FtsH-binding integral membrane protein
MTDFFQTQNFPTFFFIIVALLLAVMVYAAFKKPGKVKLIGALGLVFCIAYSIYGLIPAMGALSASNGDISPIVVYGALQTMAFQILCGLVFYMISLLLRIAKKRTDK